MAQICELGPTFVHTLARPPGSACAECSPESFAFFGAFSPGGAQARQTEINCAYYTAAGAFPPLVLIPNTNRYRTNSIRPCSGA